MRSFPGARLQNLLAAGCLLAVIGCAPRNPNPAAETLRSAPPQPVIPVDCACTLEVRYNLCARVNGADSLPPGLGLIREREGGGRDTLDAGRQCFWEWRGVQRVVLLEDGAPVESSGWFEAQTVDCCHAEAKTVEFAR